MEEDEGMSRSPNQSDKLSSYQKILKNHDPRIHESCIVFWVQWVLCITIHLGLLIKRKFGKPLIWIGDCTARQPRVGFRNWMLEFWNWGTFLLTPPPLFCSPFQILSQDKRLWSNKLVIVLQRFAKGARRWCKIQHRVNSSLPQVLQKMESLRCIGSNCRWSETETTASV